MANPQPDQFTKISNEILEVMARTKLNGTQYRILFVIIRFTYGFNRKEHELSLNYISNATGIIQRQIRRELDCLIKLNIVSVVKEAGFRTARVISLNKNYETWNIDSESIKQQSSKKSAEVGLDHSTEVGLDHSTEVGLDHSTEVGLDHQERKILKKDLKESFKERRERKESSASVPVEKIYQDNIGLITPIISESIVHWLADGIEESLIIRYIEIAVKRNKRSWGYVESMIKGNLNVNIRTLEQYEAMCVENKKSETKEDPFIKFGKAKGWIV